MLKRAKELPNCRLKNERSCRHWSQQELADQIGTTLTNVSRWERSITVPGSYFRSKLCALFGKNAEELGLYSEMPDFSIPKNELTHVDCRMAFLESTLDNYVGNNVLRSYVRDRICCDETDVYVLSGLPGIGKTALAINVIRDQKVQKRFGGNLLWTSLGPNPDICGLLSKWGDLLGVGLNVSTKPTNVEEWAVILHAHLYKMNVLFVIDDVWQIDDALAFKVGGAACKYIITTRFPKVAFQFANKEVIKISDLNLEDGLQLLTHLSPDIVKTNPAEVQQLVEIVGGYPLTLTLIGKYLHRLSHYNQPRRLEQAIKHLCSDTRARLELEQPLSPLERLSYFPGTASLSVQAAIKMSEQQLDKPARSALYALSVFQPTPGNFSEEAALAVTAANTYILDTLSDVGLLESDEPGRYYLHPTIADYASVHLEETDAYDRLINYVTCFVEKHAKNSKMLQKEKSMIYAALSYLENSGEYEGKEYAFSSLRNFNIDCR